MEQQSNCAADSSDTNPNLCPQSPKSPSNSDPDTSPSDHTAKLHEQLDTQLRLEEGESKDEKEAHEEELEQHVKEGEEGRDSIGWDEGGEVNNGESNGWGEEEDQSNDANDGGYGTHVYPVRPEAEDCSFYMKTGNCKFGSGCKFNHPVTRKIQGSKERVKEREEGAERQNQIERPNQTECKYYLRTGGCKYGKACRYNHSKARSAFPLKTAVLPASDLNFLGLPIRPGERECLYYMRHGSCKYGANCRFNHPDPTAVGGSDPLQSSSPSNVASWSPPTPLNETPFMPLTYPPTQGVPPQSPEWNGYQAPAYPPPERNIRPPPQYLRGPHQHKMSVEEFPERPGQPECSFYMKTGDCKFKFTCKYHHPKNHNSKSPASILSDKGLPLRPGKNVCSYYSRYVICKYGPGCKFDHPTQLTRSDDDEDSPYGGSVGEEEGTMVDSGNANDTAF